jgi:hypothetical protein
VFQGGPGSLASEYASGPGATCPFASSEADGYLVLDFGDAAAHDQALFDGTLVDPDR